MRGRAGSRSLTLVAAGRQVRRRALRGHSREVYAAAWNPDGQFIVTGGADRSVRLWSPDGKPGKVYLNLGNRITAPTFTKRSKELIVTRGGPEKRANQPAAARACANNTGSSWPRGNKSPGSSGGRPAIILPAGQGGPPL